ncbi:PIN domain-like protein [Backusella circina FSU 941]|nr:PIN domain-like protein [Backusella circina FSU 941]
MGVHGLTGVLTRYAPKSVRNVSPSLFAHQSIAIDASCHLNKFMYGDEPHPYKHIYGFYLLSKYCDLNHINPVFIFDGPERLEAKRLEHVKREKTRTKVKHSLALERDQTSRLDFWLQISKDKCRRLDTDQAVNVLTEMNNTLDEMETHSPDEKAILEEKIASIAEKLQMAVESAKDNELYTRTARALVTKEQEIIGDLIYTRWNEIQSALTDLRYANRAMVTSLEKRSIRITQALRSECQHFLTGLGYTCFSCNKHEAEAMCAKMSKLKRTTATVTEDLDTLVFGDAPILRYFFARTRPILCIDPIIARKELGLSKNAFIDFCILCGTDFSGTIKGIGPFRALEFIQRHGSIEKLLASLDSKYIPHDTFDYRLARKVFKSLPRAPRLSKHETTYQRSQVDQDKVEKLLAKYEIDPQEAENKVRSILLQQTILNHQTWQADPFAKLYI